ncbi:MAG: hypothetical protein ACLT5H_10400 [Collinsella stercoris]|uniref:hypothetical protein n=1 Tax=Collinsella stercoris TaxID=147206 RepID=UPI0039935DC1
MQLECDLDIRRLEQMAYAAERLSEAGAREVHCADRCQEGRPAYELQVLVRRRGCGHRGRGVSRDEDAGIRCCTAGPHGAAASLEVRDTAWPGLQRSPCCRWDQRT